MRNLGLLLAAAAGLGLVGCGDDGGTTRPPGDGGGMADDGGGMMTQDSGPIIIIDGGTRDTGTTPQPDAGGGDPDGSSSMGGICGSATEPFMPLPATCLPRCTQQTFNALQSCGEGDSACVEAAIDADTMPPAQYNVGGPEPLSIDCGICLNIQVNSCIAESCPDELDALLTCLNNAATPENPQPDPATACPDENMALDTCIMDNEQMFSSCSQQRGIMCFP